MRVLVDGFDAPITQGVCFMHLPAVRQTAIQIIGRAARNTQSVVRLYADKITDSMRKAMDETNRRRTLQQAYNEKWGITPTTVIREVVTSISKAALDLDHKKVVRCLKEIEYSLLDNYIF